MGNYQKLLKVAQGPNGKVYLAKDMEDGKVVTIKKIFIQVNHWIPGAVDYSLIKKFQLGFGDCRYCTRYLEFDSDSRCHLTHCGVQHFLYQLCKGLAFMHGRRLPHRCLHPSAIQLDAKRGIIKITDWAPFTFLDPFRDLTIFHIWYRAPEEILGYFGHPCARDMWTVGCIFAEMILGRTLFEGSSASDQLHKIFRLLGTPTEEHWPGVRSLTDWPSDPIWNPKDIAPLFPRRHKCEGGLQLLLEMLEYNPEKRISAEAALSHLYFKDIDKSQY